MAEPLKNSFTIREVVAIADRLAARFTDFDTDRFLAVATGFVSMELKERVSATADALAAAVPGDYLTALDGVIAASEPGLPGFGGWPFASFIERHGIDHPAPSLAAMRTVTKTFTCEFAIRPYLERHRDLTARAVRSWALDSDADVRRLASEGTRPLLPWARRVRSLLEDPSLGLEICEILRHDPSEMVRRSVANHLNDVAKAHPDIVAEIAARWANDPDVDAKMIRHALRTLLKDGHIAAMHALGYTSDPQIEVVEFTVAPDRIRLGDRIVLTMRLRSTADHDQRLIVDFVIEHPLASGKMSTKVFKWATVELAPHDTASATRRRLIQTATTRAYTAGTHTVSLQVAGRRVATHSFVLLDSSPPRAG